MRSSEPTCALRRLASDPKELFLGLSFSADRPTLDEAFLNCCGGLGHSFEPKSGQSVACQLVQRKYRLDRLCLQFKATWGQNFVPKTNLLRSTEISFLSQTFADYLAGSDKKGQVFTTFSKPQEPSLRLWHMAMMAAWRFGIPSYVLTLGEKLPLNRDYFHDTSVYPILFLEQKGSFLNADFAIEFGSIVNWCEQHDVPLWVDLLQFSPQAAKPKTKAFDALAAYQEKIDQINSKPPLRALGLDCKSRLRSVCKNIDLYM